MSLNDMIKNTFLNRFDCFHSLNFLLANGSYNKWKQKWRKEKNPVVICGEAFYGLCDRLRGFVTVYSICKKLNYPFKIIKFKSLDLRIYIEPAQYNWMIEPQEVTPVGTSFENVGVWLMGGQMLEHYFIKKYLVERLTQSNVQQIKVSTNACLVRDKAEFSRLFNELFRPSKLVQDQLDHYKNLLGENYLSVSTRFAGLIGDFNETYNQPLSENEREKLLDNCLSQIEKLHQKYPNQKVLVCSDSITFLEMTKKLEYVVVIEGKPVHIQFSSGSDIDTHLKTFVDFFMIADAQKIFLFMSGKMYHSGFPSTAAMVNNREFKVIKF